MNFSIAYLLFRVSTLNFIMSTQTWKIDTMHSEVQFKVKHLVISTVTGSFKNFDAKIEMPEGDFSNANFWFEADINSIDTGNEQRDAHLKSNDFFNAEAFPKMRLEGSKMKKTSDTSFELSGNLTIRDITKTVTLAVSYGGSMVDFYGQTKAGFELTGKINRKEFGLTWNGVTEAGGIVVSDEVRLIANLQFTLEQ